MSTTRSQSRTARLAGAWSCGVLTAAAVLTSGQAAVAAPAVDHSGDDQRPSLSWAPPALDHPTTVRVTSRTRTLKLKQDRDYVLDLPDDEPVSLRGGLTVAGGHNVVLIGGEIRTCKDSKGAARGLYLKGQTGTVHVEGLRLAGAGATEGINLDERRGATVQLQNIAVNTVHGSYHGRHADVLQTWAGPEKLRVDRLDGSTTYQGFFLDPHKFGDVTPHSFDIRNTVLRDSGRTSAYLLWQSGQFPVRTTGVTVVRNTGKPFPKQVLHSGYGQGSWSAVSEGSSSTPTPLVGDPGPHYSTPGYAGTDAPATRERKAPGAPFGVDPAGQGQPELVAERGEGRGDGRTAGGVSHLSG